MAQFFPNRLTCDAVDRYNHKWMVLLLLLLALVSFIIPLHPSYRVGESQGKPTGQASVSVDCWCPVQFSRVHIQYANDICSSGYNAALRGEVQAVVYPMADEHIPIARQSDISESMKEYIDLKRQEDERAEKGKDLAGRLQNMMTFQVPIMLLLAAVLLTVPQIIWSFLSACCGSFSVEETLESASHASHCLDASSRQQVFDDINLSMAQGARSCPKSLSIFYLTKKVLAVLMALVLVLVVSQYALPELEEINKDLDSFDLPLTFKNSSGEDNPFSYMSSLEDDKSISTHVHSTDLLRQLDPVFICKFLIRQLSNVVTYNVQCTVTVLDQKTKSSSSNERSILDFESLLLKIVTALLVVLTVGNVVSLCSWLCKLVSTGSRTALGLTSTTNMDIVFVVQMARLNASVDVVRRLARSSGKDEGEMKSLTEPHSVNS